MLLIVLWQDIYTIQYYTHGDIEEYANFTIEVAVISEKSVFISIMDIVYLMAVVISPWACHD